MRTADFLRLIALAAIWGASFLFMRIVAPVLGAMPTAFFRALLGALGLVLILALLRTKWEFRGKLGWAMALGVINSAIPFVISGGTSRAGGFMDVFKQEFDDIKKKNFPIKISDIRQAKDPMTAVAEGLLVLAMQEHTE